MTKTIQIELTLRNGSEEKKLCNSNDSNTTTEKEVYSAHHTDVHTSPSCRFIRYHIRSFFS